MTYYTLKILELRKETIDTITIVFKQPALKKIKYQAGQYLTLIFRINGRRYIRPYSFSSSPLDANLEVTVKRVPGGVVSNHIIDVLNVGDIVEVMKPMGDFTLNNEYVSSQSHLVLWGAGGGITPLMSIAKYALTSRSVAHVTLVYGNRNAETAIFAKKITDLKADYEDKFSQWHFHTKPVIDNNNPDVIQGRIDSQKVLSIMASQGRLENTLHYICGPVGLKESVKMALISLGINDDRVFTEDFEIVRDPKEFEDVITSKVVITKGDVSTEVEVIKGKSVLEAGLDALIDLSYSCQTGSCLVCRASIKKGNIKMIGLQHRPKELHNNECLLCCSFPLNEDIEIGIE